MSNPPFRMETGREGEVIEYTNTQRHHESHGSEATRKEKRQAQAQDATLAAPVQVER